MPIRLSLPIVERAVQFRLASVQEPNLRALVEIGFEESEVVEFKREFPLTEPGLDELAKDVCALANARGGVIFYGIAELQDQPGRAGELTPFSHLSGDVRQRVAAVLRARCRPAPPMDVAVVPSESSPGCSYVVLAVPPSGDAPHARLRRNDNETWYQFPRRHESDTVFLSESELAAAYDLRWRYFGQRQQRIEELRLARPNPRGDTTPVVEWVIVAVPATPGRVEITDALAAEWGRKVSDLHRFDWSFGCGPLISAEQRLIIRSGIRLKGHFSYLDLLNDGSSVLALGLDDERIVHGVHDRRSGLKPIGVELATPTINALAFLHLASNWALTAAGTAGDLLVSIGLAAPNSQAGTSEMWLVGPEPVLGGNLHVPLAYFSTASSARADAVMSSELFLEQVGKEPIASLHRIMSEICQSLGVAESPLTTSEGLVATAAWPRGRVEQVASFQARISPAEQPSE